MRKMMMTLLAAALLLSIGGCSASPKSSKASVKERFESDYWPEQKTPKAYRRITVRGADGSDGDSGRAFNPNHMAAASLAGIAAAAVNDGVHDELLWIELGRPVYQQWLSDTAQTASLQERPTMDVSAAIRHYAELGLVKGYVVYTFDPSEGRVYREREGMDRSVNAATMIAAARGAILADASMVEELRALGLEEVADARELSEAEAYELVGDALSTRGFFTVDPRVAHVRDFAIAHRLPVTYGTGDFFQSLLIASEANSLVQGWNAGDESKHTAPLSHHGLVQTASNWASNLPVLQTAVYTKLENPLPSIDPSTLDDPIISFMLSDGDNVQYLLGSFHEGRDYWSSPLRGEFPVGWTFCGVHLSQVAPVVLTHLQRTASPNDDLIEFSGGYFYPDLMGIDRPNRREILERHADMLAARMAVTGSRILTFICKDVTGEASMEAYQIFADRIPNLLGMIAVQYAPYNGGHGAIMWITSADGERIPVLTPRYAIWQRAGWKGGGTPARIARLMNELVTEASGGDEYANALVSVHAWSRFQLAPGDDEQAENVPESRDGDEPNVPTYRGLYPMKWTIDRLDPTIRVVTPEEHIIRLRIRDQRDRQGLSQ